MLAAALLLAVACEIPDPRAGPRHVEPVGDEVAFRLLGPNGAALIVPVHVNGEGPFDFVFDTGATLTCVDRSLVEVLGLEGEPVDTGVGIGVGGAGQVSVVRFDSVRVGRASVSELPGCIIDLGHVEIFGTEIQGLVGLNFMRSYTVTLNFENESLRLEP